MIPKKHIDPVLNGTKCPYCGKATEYVDSACIYGRSYGMIYLCRPCDAYCGVHKGTDISLGRLANRELRELKKRVHAEFDILWAPKPAGCFTRKQAYRWLADKMGLPIEETHIGMFSEELCRKAIVFLTPYLP
jgi:hypothetical protein